MSPQLTVGSTGGNRVLKGLLIGSTGGNRNIKQLWAGSTGGNRLIFSYGVAPSTSITVTPIDYDTLRISWSASTEATAYYVQRYAVGWGTVSTSTGLTWDNNGLNDGTEYEYRVIVTDGSTQSDPTSTGSGVTVLKLPVLNRVERGPIGYSQGSIYYNDGGSVAESEIRIYAALGGGGFVHVDTAPSNSTQQDIGSLSPASTYTVKVCNYNAAYGESAFSTTDSFVTAPGGPDWAATYPKDTSTSDDEIDLRLIAEPGSTGYDVYYRVSASMGGDPLGSGVNLGTFTGAQIAAAVYRHGTGEAHGTVMYYQCRSRDVLGPGQFGSEANATVTMRAPGVPSSVVATYSTAAEMIDVKWVIGSPANEDNFRLQQASKPYGGAYGAWGAAGTPASGSTSSTGHAVAPGFYYKYQIRAENAAANSSYAASNEVTVADPPAAPTGVVATLTGSTDYTSRIVVKWTPPASGTVTYQEIEYKADGAAWTGTPQSTGLLPASTSLTQGGLGDDVLYAFRVRGYNPVDGGGAWSSTAGTDHEQYTYPSIPNAPSWTATFPKFKQATDDTILLKWLVGADVTGYNIYASASSGAAALLSTTTNSTYSHTGLAEDTLRYYRLKAKREAQAAGSTQVTWSTYSAEGNARTLINKPAGFTVNPMSTATGDITVKWTNLNSTGSERSELMTLDRYTSTWATVAANIAGGSTDYTDTSASTSVSKYRIKYNGESNYSEAFVPL